VTRLDVHTGLAFALAATGLFVAAVIGDAREEQGESYARLFYRAKAMHEDSTPCRPPKRGQRLIVDTDDGKPFCTYLTRPGFGEGARIVSERQPHPYQEILP
jgi:hypothetical protein